MIPTLESIINPGVLRRHDLRVATRALAWALWPDAAHRLDMVVLDVVGCGDEALAKASISLRGLFTEPHNRSTHLRALRPMVEDLGAAVALWSLIEEVEGGDGA